MSDKNPFAGPDRIGVWEVTGHPMRMGELSDLAVSDKDRMEEAIEQGNFEEASARFQLFYGVQTAIITTFVEWNYAIPAALSELTSAELPPLIERVTEKWRESSQKLVPGPIHDSLEELLAPESIDKDRVTKFRADLVAENVEPLKALFRVTAPVFEAALKALDGGSKEEALTGVRETMTLMRGAHDSLGLYNWAWIAGISESLSQELAEKAMHNSFESCSFIAGLWGLVSQISPRDLAAFLADHLRTGHLSGPGRGGSVSITETDDFYRLEMDACGTGGALRRDLGTAEGLGRFKEATAATWGRTGEVPAYCAHCAQNEIESIKRFGYPAWITDFQPDPQKPCAWLIYKDPKAIPEDYYKRVGQVKALDV